MQSPTSQEAEVSFSQQNYLFTHALRLANAALGAPTKPGVVSQGGCFQPGGIHLLARLLIQSNVN